MKKVLISKAYTDKNDQINCPKYHKHIKDPIYYWETRNNSSNVAAILHPDNYISSNRLKVLGKFKIDDSNNNNVKTEYPLSTNNCYCKTEKIRPKLLSRPKSCVFIEHQPQQYDNWRRKSLSEKLDRIQDSDCCCVVQRKWGSSDENEEINSLHFTRDRLECERYREAQKKDELEKVAKFDEKHSRIASFYSNEHNELPTKGEVSVSTNTAFTSKDLNQFRKTHYFDTHSTYKEGGNIPEHKCLHEYELDDRLIPKPVHTDVFGRSTCSICEKSTDNIGIYDNLTRINYKSISDNDLNRFKKAAEYGLRPKSVNTVDANKKILLNFNDYCNFTALLDSVKPIFYRDSLALRHQRMKPQK